MRRKTLDRLLSAAGLVVAAVLLIAGGMLVWAHSYVHNQVRDQLSAQQIFFPANGSDALKSPDIGPYLNQYAGQQLVNGKQAEAYANHFIAVHLKEMAGGQTYAQLSGKSLANPNDAQLAGQVQTMFRGETLRGLLLNAYAFDTMATVALIGGIVAFIGGGLMIVLSVLGLIHARQIADTEPAPPTRQEVTV
ncbi:hypothetical protein ACPPVT_17880 [Angustibacter sp. McL0619]|uniref:hypothetical protein n=1 Tax=Angustibacter sp. McL0619 TaxID=3415676 RepID=UPI003CEB1218